MKKIELKIVRNLVRIGNAQGLTLPKLWLDSNKIKVGNKLLIMVELLK